jgi:hypothetical protein
MIMKAKILTYIFCFTTLFVFAENRNDFNQSYKYSKKRTIDANFEVADNYALSLTGRYSDYKISTWDENYVSFHVEIITKSNKQETAEEMLYAIDVDFDNAKIEKKINAKTVINKNNIKNVSFQISYYVMVPHDIAISINNLYGDVQMDKANKDLYIDMKYGDFSIDDIFTHAEINLLYGDADIKNAKQITARLNYGDINVVNVNKVLLTMNYGSANFDAVDVLSGKLNYSDIELGNVSKTADISVNYGDVEINNMNNDFELIKVQANYSDIELLLNETMRFSYEVTLLYGDINNDLIEKYARRITEKSYQTYISGNINDSEGKHKIIINGNYSDVD